MEVVREFFLCSWNFFFFFFLKHDKLFKKGNTHKPTHCSVLRAVIFPSLPLYFHNMKRVPAHSRGEGCLHRSSESFLASAPTPGVPWLGPDALGRKLQRLVH